MTLDEIYLKSSYQANLEIGSFGVMYVDAREGNPLTVCIAVETDEDRDYTLRPGETFPVRDQTWKLDRVDNADKSDWTVVLTRVE